MRYAGKLRTISNAEISTKTRHKQIMNICTKISIVLIYLCEFIAIYDKSLCVITGPIFIVTMMFLQFTDYFYIPLTVTIVPLAALGTLFNGRIAVHTLLLPLLIIRLLVKGTKFKVRVSDFMLFILGLLHIGQLLAFENYELFHIKTLAVFATICWFLYIRCQARENQELLNKVLFSLAICISVDAVASLLSGGYTLYANSDRMGLAGVTGGNPNHAAFYIGVAIAIILSIQNIKLWIKLTMLFSLIILLITTVSVSGFIGVSVVILSFFIFTTKNKHKLRFFLCIFLIIITAIALFPAMNIESDSTIHSTSYIDYYQEKLLDRLGNLNDSKYDDATSNRTSLTNQNLEYFNSHSTLNQIFGMNSANPLNTNVSHNSFVDILLRFGYVGLFIVALLVIYRFYKQYIYARKTGDSVLLMCKIALLFWSFTISMFDGVFSCIWFGILLIF